MARRPLAKPRADTPRAPQLARYHGPSSFNEIILTWQTRNVYGLLRAHRSQNRQLLVKKDELNIEVWAILSIYTENLVKVTGHRWLHVSKGHTTWKSSGEFQIMHYNDEQRGRRIRNLLREILNLLNRAVSTHRLKESTINRKKTNLTRYPGLGWVIAAHDRHHQLRCSGPTLDVYALSEARKVWCGFKNWSSTVRIDPATAQVGGDVLNRRSTGAVHTNSIFIADGQVFPELV
ncbi:hypothetical protein EVAR_4135_1 [Eumeta japonica]|uniref:Uncharacterized protein n=1 Tax=Eumeta variegata TaxID=151549 RepID=A0A4C1TIZ6_EUMVA|nr:hypothetical protein EVAR_4135_1 [Eumeta japonica]